MSANEHIAADPVPAHQPRSRLCGHGEHATGDPRANGHALDAELRGLRIEERASFAPELEGELQRRRFEPADAGRGGRHRLLMAAGVALLLIGVAVPPARASLVALMHALADARAQA